MTAATAAPPRRRLTVEVSDPIGQQQVLLEGVRSTATVNETRTSVTMIRVSRAVRVTPR